MFGVDFWPQFLMAAYLVFSPSVALGATIVQWKHSEKSGPELIGFTLSKLLGAFALWAVLYFGGFWL